MLVLMFALIFPLTTYASDEDVAYVETLIESITDQESMEAAREAYDALSTADKLSVSNYQTLTEAEENGFEESTAAQEETSQTNGNIESTAEETESTDSVGNIAVSDQIGYSQSNPATEDAEDIYWYAFSFESQTMFILEAETDIDAITFFSPEGEEIIIEENESSYSDEYLNAAFTWNNTYLTITVKSAAEGEWFIHSESAVNITVQKSISAIQETEEIIEENNSSSGLIAALIIIIAIIIFCFLFSRKKTSLKRKELPKRTPEEEIDKIRQELEKYDFNDYGRQPDLSFLDKKEEEHFDISVEESYEELEDGTRNLHGLSYEEESRKYMKKEKEYYD